MSTKRKQRPYPLVKPITRRINDDLVVTITSAGVVCRRYKCRKAVLVPWEYVLEAGTKRAAGKPPAGRLFDDPRKPDLKKLGRFSLKDLLQIDDIAQQPATSNQQPATSRVHLGRHSTEKGQHACCVSNPPSRCQPAALRLTARSWPLCALQGRSRIPGLESLPRVPQRLGRDQSQRS